MCLANKKLRLFGVFLTNWCLLAESNHHISLYVVDSFHSLYPHTTGKSSEFQCLDQCDGLDEDLQ